MEASLGGRLGLEVELLEDAHAELAQHRSRVDPGERRAQRHEQRVEQREVLAHVAREPRAQHLDGDGLAVEHAAVHLGDRRHGGRRRLE